MEYPIVTLHTSDVSPSYRGAGAGFQNHIMYRHIGKSPYIEGFTFCGLSVPVSRAKGWYLKGVTDTNLGPITRHSNRTCKLCVQRDHTGNPVSPDTGYMGLAIQQAQDRERKAA